MLGFIATAVAAFVATNIDDLFILMLLYAGATTRRAQGGIVVGRYIGTGVLLAISFLGAFGLGFINETYLGLFGLIPISLGVKEWIVARRKKTTDADGERIPAQSGFLLATVMLTVSCGADNIGVYIPLLTSYSLVEGVGFVGIFVLMTAIWCLSGTKLLTFSLLREKLQKHKRTLVPALYILLGIYILIKNAVT